MALDEVGIHARLEVEVTRRFIELEVDFFLNALDFRWAVQIHGKDFVLIVRSDMFLVPHEEFAEIIFIKSHVLESGTVETFIVRGIDCEHERFIPCLGIRKVEDILTEGLRLLLYASLLEQVTSGLCECD